MISVETHRDSEWIYGHKVDAVTKTVIPHSTWFQETPEKYKERMWYLNPQKNFKTSVDPKQFKEFEDLIDCDIDGLYYFASAADGTDGVECMKWIMGPMAAKLKEISGSFEKVGTHIMCSIILRYFVKCLLENKFNRTFAKDIFQELIDKKKSLWHDFSYDYCLVIPLEDNEEIRYPLDNLPEFENWPEKYYWSWGICYKNI